MGSCLDTDIDPAGHYNSQQTQNGSPRSFYLFIFVEGKIDNKENLRFHAKSVISVFKLFPCECMSDSFTQKQYANKGNCQ